MLRRFGRLIPDDWAHVHKYPLRAVTRKIIKNIEFAFALPDDMRLLYDQGMTSSCVGYSSSIMMSIFNEPERYNAIELWEEAKDKDEFEETNRGDDNGTTINAACKVLKAKGHIELGKKRWSKRNGIKEYRWALDIDDIRRAFAIYKVPVLLGIDWYNNFNKPYQRDNGEWWIGRGFDSRVIGGHAICAIGCSDKREALLLCNSWGTEYPLVWIDYSLVERLLKNMGEAVIVVDRPGR